VFVNREREREFIERKLRSPRAELVVIYGRRRVGKTFLLENTLKDAIFFTADLSNPFLLMNRFFDQLKELNGIPERARIDDWDSFFQVLHQTVRLGKARVFVFDEFQYIPQRSEEFLSVMQRWWDCCLSKTDVKIFLCGSSVGMMERIVMEVSSPLYGRRTGQYRVLPFDFFESQLLLNRMECHDRILSYATLGGIPLYLLEFQPYSFYNRALLEKLLTPGEFLVEEGKFLFLEEFKKDPSNYVSIMKSISSGRRTPNEISNDTGIEYRKLATYLSRLVELGIVGREYPFSLRTPPKKPLYYVKDEYLRFYFKYIYPNVERIYRGKGEDISREIFRDLHIHVSFVFEDIARQYITRLLNPDKIGRWWTSNAEIDIVAVKGDELIVGECKWRNKPMDFRILRDLEGKTSKLLESLNFSPRIVRYFLFSKSGFDDSVSPSENVMLIDLRDLCTSTNGFQSDK